MVGIISPVIISLEVCPIYHVVSIAISVVTIWKFIIILLVRWLTISVKHEIKDFRTLYSVPSKITFRSVMLRDAARCILVIRWLSKHVLVIRWLSKHVLGIRWLSKHVMVIRWLSKHVMVIRWLSKHVLVIHWLSKRAKITDKFTIPLAETVFKLLL